MSYSCYHTLNFPSTRKTSGTNENAIFTLSSAIKNVKSVRVKQVYIPFTYYTFHDGNNTLTMKYGGTDYDVTITAGDYTGTTLATEMQTRLNAHASMTGFTVSYSSSTKKFTFANSTVSAVVYTCNVAPIIGFSATPTPATSISSDFEVYNSTFSFFDANRSFIINNGSDRTVYISAGNYSATTLATELQTVINAHGSLSGFTVTFNSSNYKFTLTHGSVSFVVKATGTAAAMIGFTEDSTSALTATGDTIAKLDGPDYVYIRSNLLTERKNNGITTNSRHRDVLYKVNIKESHGLITNDDGDKNPSVTYNYSSTLSFSTIDLRLETEDGQLLDLNTRNWGCSIEFETS